jgi:hypothetical protein
MLADRANFGAALHRGQLTWSNLLTPNERPVSIPFLL